MKRYLGLGALILLSSFPAHAQFKASSVGAVIGFGFGYGGGGIAGGLGKATFPAIQSTPMPAFAIITVSGTEADFVPTIYLPFSEAFAEGQAVMAKRPKSIAEVAEENLSTPRLKARFIFVQDAQGFAVIWPLQQLEQVAIDPSTLLRASK